MQPPQEELARLGPFQTGTGTKRPAEEDRDVVKKFGKERQAPPDRTFTHVNVDDNTLQLAEGKRYLLMNVCCHKCLTPIAKDGDGGIWAYDDFWSASDGLLHASMLMSTMAKESGKAVEIYIVDTQIATRASPFTPSNIVGSFRIPRKDDVEPGPHFDGVKTLALCKPSPGILEHEAAAIKVFEEYPLDQWYNLGQWLHNRQLLFGPRPGQHRAAHSDVIPAPLLEMFKHARAALLAEAPDFGEIPETPSGCAINRYATTPNGKGNGLGLHRDKGQWKPLVIGVTLVESRTMALSEEYKANAKRRYEFITAGARCTPSATRCTRNGGTRA